MFICKGGATKSYEDNRGEERNNNLEELLSYFNPWETVILYSTVKSTALCWGKNR